MMHVNTFSSGIEKSAFFQAKTKNNNVFETILLFSVWDVCRKPDGFCAICVLEIVRVCFCVRL